MNNLNNLDVRLAVLEEALKYKDIAKYMGISPEWLSKLMSRDLTPTNKDKIMKAISILSETKESINPIQFNVVECVESGKGFIKGCYYAQVGTNNGIQIVREGKGGDCEMHLFCTGGIGKGTINNWDETGSPSFINREVKIK